MIATETRWRIWCQVAGRGALTRAEVDRGIHPKEGVCKYRGRRGEAGKEGQPGLQAVGGPQFRDIPSKVSPLQSVRRLCKKSRSKGRQRS